jgi:putative membrane protein
VRISLIPYSVLPTVNACLNALCALLLATGFVLIRQKRIAAHRAVMISAFCVSVVFLASYLTYHAHAGVHRYPGTGARRAFYLALLGTHTVLAAVTLPLAVTTLALALRGLYPRHRRLAHWTLPIWFYVSVSGVVVYWMLYR